MEKFIDEGIYWDDFSCENYICVNDPAENFAFIQVQLIKDKDEMKLR